MVYCHYRDERRDEKKRILCSYSQVPVSNIEANNDDDGLMQNIKGQYRNIGVLQKPVFERQVSATKSKYG